MIKALNQNEEQETKIYRIHLEKLHRLHENKTDKSLIKKEQAGGRKEINGDPSDQFIALFGKDK